MNSTVKQSALLMAVVGILSGATKLQAGESPVQISMTSLAYVPKQIEISAGQSVVWLNTALTDHSAVSNDGKAFDTGLIAPKAASTPIAFPTPGTYMYHCKMHGNTMSGLVLVKPKP